MTDPRLREGVEVLVTSAGYGSRHGVAHLRGVSGDVAVVAFPRNVGLGGLYIERVPLSLVAYAGLGHAQPWATLVGVSKAPAWTYAVEIPHQCDVVQVALHAIESLTAKGVDPKTVSWWASDMPLWFVTAMAEIPS